MNVRWHLARGAATLLRWLSVPFLLIGALATPILCASAWCEDRARALACRICPPLGPTLDTGAGGLIVGIAVRNPLIDARRQDPEWRDPLPKQRDTARPYREPADAREPARTERTFRLLTRGQPHP